MASPKRADVLNVHAAIHACRALHYMVPRLSRAWRKPGEAGITLDCDTTALVNLPEMKDWSVTRFLREIRERRQRFEKMAAARDHVLFDNVTLLADALALNDVERDLLELAALASAVEGLRESFELTKPLELDFLAKTIAASIGRSGRTVLAALQPSATLRSTGLLIWGGARFAHNGAFRLRSGLPSHLFTKSKDAFHLLRHLFRRAPASSLSRADYPHLTDRIDLAVRLVREASARKTKGLNILLYGPPGTGKTELSRVLAAEIGAPLVEVNVACRCGAGLDRDERLDAFRIAQRVLQAKRPALILFDEVEDVFLPRWLMSRGDLGKGALNRLMEEHRVPTIWACNTLSGMDSSQARRFDLVIEMRRPPAAVRRRVLDRRVGDYTRADWRERWAADDRLAPAHIDRAARVLDLVGTTTSAEAEEVLEQVLKPQLALTGRARRRPMTAGATYDPALSNTIPALAPIVEGLSETRHGTMLLHGPPGTGKTAFVRHLAEAMGAPLITKRASDLLGMYVGQTEAAIAAMFEEATDEGAILMLDEADSFLRDRQGAHRSWEVTQVNELLVQMETFEGLFVCATNLLKDLDRAALRRFGLKVQFAPLTPPQAANLLEGTLRSLGVVAPKSATSRVQQIPGLTPGDFAAVARTQRMLSTTPTPTAILNALQAEVDLRNQGRTRTIGGFTR